MQAAYEVLADPQERAWYDSHRDEILYGGDDGAGAGEDYSYNTKLTSAEDINKVIMQFDPRMKFTDSPTGFFGGLRELFDKLAHEEKLACQWEGHHDAAADYPSFGSKGDDYETIRPFYSIWTHFATNKSFMWKDQYRYSDAPDRRVRRLMEKENQRIREQAIREYNDAVRSLVAFVKKRDPRWCNLQSDAERQKALRDAAATQAARSRAANAAKMQDYVVSEWAKTSDADATDDEFVSSDSTEDDDKDVFECMACNKAFKSQNQLEAHERSKKHIKALKQLRRSMKQDDDLLNDQDPLPTEETLEESDETAEEAPLESPQASLKENPQKETSDATAIIATPENPETGTTSDDEDEDYVPREVLEERLLSPRVPEKGDGADGLQGVTRDMATATLSGSEKDDTPTHSKKFKTGKAKQKRAKKASTGNEGDPSFECGVCATAFPSRTKLFNHIKDQGHAQLKSVATDSGSGKKGKKRR